MNYCPHGVYAGEGCEICSLQVSLGKAAAEVERLRADVEMWKRVAKQHDNELTAARAVIDAADGCANVCYNIGQMAPKNIEARYLLNAKKAAQDFDKARATYAATKGSSDADKT